MSFVSIFLVGAGGFLGSIARYITVHTVDQRLNAVFPYGTITVNLVGSFIMGFVIGILEKQTTPGHWKLFLTTGFCGGFTTFSAFAFENVSLIQKGMALTSLVYVLGSILLGGLAVIAGIFLGRLTS